jgi:hypothetical protein
VDPGVAAVEFASPDPIAVVAVAAIHAPAAKAHTISVYPAVFFICVMIDRPLCKVVHEGWRDAAYRPLTVHIPRSA